MRGRLAAASILCAATAAPAASAPGVYPTGVTIYDPAKAWNSFVLFDGTDHKTHLIDMNGHVSHMWDRAGFPSEMVDPSLADGRKCVLGTQLSSISLAEALTVSGATGVIPGGPAQFRDKTFGYVGWDDEVLWEWGEAPRRGNALQHRDWERLPGGDTLLLSSGPHRLDGFGDREMSDDVIYEVSTAGHVFWSWSSADHLAGFGFTPSELDLVRHSGETDFLHINDMHVLGPKRWRDAGDTRFAPDNVVISSRDGNVTAIIDRATGAIVWRLGPDHTPRGSDYKPETAPRPIEQIAGQRDAHMIVAGLPGAGDVLLLDNQGKAGYPPAKVNLTGGSRVLEIDPVTMRIV